LFFSALLAGATQAAELGEPRVSSHIGQPLVADIELTMLEDAANPVQVRLAHPNVYKGASIGMPAVLSTLRMSVMRRDGRQFLHVTSLGAVESEHLHLYLELADGSQRTVRLATLFLTPDPHPAPPPAPVAPPVPVKAAEPEPKPLPVPAPAPAKPAPVPAKPKPAPHSMTAHALPKPLPKPEPKPAPPPAGAACAPQPKQDVDACVVLGAKNAMLREQLGQLEDKVRVLQVAVGASPAAVMEPVKAHKPKKKKPEPPPEAGTSWALVGGAAAGVLALLGGLVVFLRRRKATGKVAEPRAGLGARLKARLQRKPAPAASASGVEPTLDERAQEMSTQA
jgi:pilus assembly protein FimV